MTCLEEVTSDCPFTVRRRAKWSECDPAGVVYTAVFSDYVIGTAELFYESLLGMPPQQAKAHHSFGTPTRALEFDFRLSLRPDEYFDMVVKVAAVTERTYTLEMHGRTLQGEMIFFARLTPVCVARSERKSISIPLVFRKVLLGYQEKWKSYSEHLGDIA